MGIVQQSADVLKSVIKKHNPQTMVELGAQNLYFQPYYPVKNLAYSSEFFTKLGLHDQTSIDITGENGAKPLDLSKKITSIEPADLVTNFGTIEHVKGGLYMPLNNVFDFCKVGGIIIHEMPETESWHNHGNYYFTEEIYRENAKLQKYEVLDTYRFAAMGNTLHGWTVGCVLKKTEETKRLNSKQKSKIKYLDA